MEFMILIHGDESSPRLAPGDPGFDEFMGSWFAYNQMLIEGGHWVSGANLAPTSSATTLRLTPGQATEIGLRQCLGQRFVFDRHVVELPMSLDMTELGAL